MVYYLLAFCLLAVWSLLRHLGAERSRRLATLQADRVEPSKTH